MPEIETQEEKTLYNEMKLLVKRANQRMLRLERETGLKESFASKQLIDYLSSKPISAITDFGRISINKNYTLMQQKAIIKATKEFLEKSESTIKGIKSYVSKYSDIAGKKLSYKMASTYYQITHDLSWLYDTSMTDSAFWSDFAPLVKTMDKESWIDAVYSHRSDTTIPDRNLQRKLEMLYNYVKGD